jgi:actin-related protein
MQWSNFCIKSKKFISSPHTHGIIKCWPKLKEIWEQSLVVTDTKDSDVDHQKHWCPTVKSTWRWVLGRVWDGKEPL